MLWSHKCLEERHKLVINGNNILNRKANITDEECRYIVSLTAMRATECCECPRLQNKQHQAMLPMQTASKCCHQSGCIQFIASHVLKPNLPQSTSLCI